MGVGFKKNKKMIHIDLTKSEDDPGYTSYVFPESKKPKINDDRTDLAIARQFQVADDFEFAMSMSNEIVEKNSSSSSSSSGISNDDDQTVGIVEKMQEQEDLALAKSLSHDTAWDGSSSSSSSSSSSNDQDSLRLAREMQCKEDGKKAQEWQEEEDLQIAKQLRKYYEEEQKAGATKQTAVVPVDLPLSAQRAMQHVTAKARNMSVATRPWFSVAVLNAAVDTVQACDVVIHINPDSVLHFLVKDVLYRNHYEIVGGSGEGGLEAGGRFALENR